jgi:hypothetical protein
MKRGDFIRNIVRIILLLSLAFLAVFTGSRVTGPGNSCSECPGNGICRGETDCQTFLK